MSGHPGSLGPVFNDPEHLSGRNVFHGLGTGKVPRLWLQGFAQLSRAIAFTAMTHFAGHGFGTFFKDFFASFNTCTGWNAGLPASALALAGILALTKLAGAVLVFLGCGQGPLSPAQAELEKPNPASASTINKVVALTATPLA
jgi:hypothetical protein